MRKNNLVIETKVLKRKISKTHEIIGDSPAIIKIKQTIEKVAPTDARVMITGKNGTGKNWLHGGYTKKATALICSWLK